MSNFASSNETDYNLLCQLLNEGIEEKIYKINGFIPPELASKNVNERYKRVDILAEAAGKKINVELNSSYGMIDRVRNINYYFSFCSQHTEAGDEYDTETLFIHVSLNYRISMKEPLICRYQFYDKKMIVF